jgi:hypothetical protein
MMAMPRPPIRMPGCSVRAAARRRGWASWGHVLMENRSGLVVGAGLTQANGFAERNTAVMLIEDVPGRHRITIGADRAYDATDFVAALRQLNATPHVAQNTSGRTSRIDRRTVRHQGYFASQRARKRIEEAFAWVKTIAGQAKTKFRGIDRVGWAFTLAAAAYKPDPPTQAPGSRAVIGQGSRAWAVCGAHQRIPRPTAYPMLPAAPQTGPIGHSSAAC